MVSVIIPCRNEVRTIGGLLDDLAHQGMADLTVVVADGCSTDGTWEALVRRAEAASDPFRLVPVQNPDKTIPHGLNRAVAAAPDGIIIRVDAHGRIGPGYLAAIAAAIGERQDLLVGPRITMVPGARTRLAGAIATILGTAIGTGGTPSRGRLREPRQVAHTVMSCWHRSVWLRNSGFDEALLSNEDFDFDWRARSSGCQVLSLPDPEYRLEARATLLALLRQRWRYGWWKAAVVRRHPRSLHMRQLLPVVELLSIPSVALAAPLWLSVLAPLWCILVVIASYRAAIRRAYAPATITLLSAPLIVAIIHLGWAAGLCLGLLCNHPGPRQAARETR